MITNYLKLCDAAVKNRWENIKREPQLLSDTEKRDLIEGFHPDYDKNLFAEIPLGKNKGEKVPKILAEILSGRSEAYERGFINAAADDYADTLVIGGGGAGCSAALEAIKYGSVIMATKFRLGDGNTVMAEGGIQAADKSGDSPEKHFDDTFRGGGGSGDKALIKTLAENGKSAIEFLENLGVGFDRSPSGELVERHGGGTSFPRMHSAKDCTGLEIMRVLKKEVYSSEVKVLEYLSAIELLVSADGKAAGAVFKSTFDGEITVVRAKSVIVATGGAGRLCYGGFPTSNSYGATADGLVLLYRAGCSLVDADSVQFHPTGSVYPSYLLGGLVTEKARAMGAKLVNARGEVFINSLETRDAVCAAIIKECRDGRGVNLSGGKGVFLDIPMIDEKFGAGKIISELPNLYQTYLRAGIDVTKYPILVYPTQHYQNGGVKIDVSGETEIENLYAVGEVAGGLHGRNRLMGNSLLDIIVFGRRAGLAAGKKANGLRFSDPSDFSLAEFYSSGNFSKDFSPIILPKVIS